MGTNVGIEITHIKKLSVAKTESDYLEINKYKNSN